ncbi:MAG: RNA polymerase sigma factor, partial [Planctomycetota bacterium]
NEMNTPDESPFRSAANQEDPSNKEDLDLVRRTLEGDPAGYDELYQKYRERVYRIIFRVVRNREDALEGVQEVFVKAYQALERFDPRARFFTWMYRISVNHGIDVIRRRSVRKEQIYDQEFTLPQHGAPISRRFAPPGSDLEKREIAERIGAAVEALSEKHRTVFELYSYEELNYGEIAEVLDVPIGTVMSRLFYARKRIKEALPEDWDPGGPRRREDRRRG